MPPVRRPQGNVAASWKQMLSGMRKSRCSSATTYSANAPVASLLLLYPKATPHTRSPGRMSQDTFAPFEMTMPAKSRPAIEPCGMPACAILASDGFKPTHAVLTRTFVGDRFGVVTVTTFAVPGPWTTIALLDFDGCVMIWGDNSWYFVH